MTAEPSPPEPASGPRRKPRHVRAAARLLQKEARRILRRHAKRIPEAAREEILAAVAAIDDGTARGDLAAVEAEAERLDGLLETHAAFARKGPLRETLENVSVAVIVALGLRACVYEPFQIPSGSMMPTLLPGDHIFVNKFVYGIQIPFTNTVVGADWREVGRGDVVVFRYPLDESDDYIKRVIGLPGDEIEVRGRQVFVKPKGADRFEPIEQEPLDERCRDETGTKIVPNCRLYRERYGDHVYTVRYVRPELAPLGEFQRFVVPEGHLFVMGDNRNQSEDSRAWMVRVEAVAADRVLTVADLRELTDESLFTLSRRSDEGDAAHPNRDAVVYRADHRSSEQDVILEVFRRPVVGVDAAWALVPDPERFARAADLLDAAGIGADERARVEGAMAPFESFAVGKEDRAWILAAVHRPTESFLVLSCGVEACPSRADLVRRGAQVLGRYLQDPAGSAADLLWDDGSVRYRTQVSKAPPRERFAFRAEVPPGPADLTVLRNPPYGIERALDLLFAAAGTRRGTVPHDPEVGVPGGLSWILPARPADAHLTWIGADLARRVAVAVRCPRSVCPDEAALRDRVRPLVRRLPDVGSDPRAFAAWAAEAGARPTGGVGEGAPYERLSARGSRKDGAYQLAVSVVRKPKAGLAAEAARVLEADGARDVRPVPAIGPDVRAYRTAGGDLGLVVPVPATATLVHLTCSQGLCPNPEVLEALGRRAHERASDAATFVDPDAMRPKPYVPRGNVKGRADRIWWPPGRFWKRID